MILHEPLNMFIKYDSARKNMFHSSWVYSNEKLFPLCCSSRNDVITAQMKQTGENQNNFGPAHMKQERNMLTVIQINNGLFLDKIYFNQVSRIVFSLRFIKRFMLFHRRSRRAESESRRYCDHSGAGGHRMVQRNLQRIFWVLPYQLRQKPGEFH